MFTLILLCACFSFTSAICYYPDQTTSPQDVPCQDSSGPSNCCGPDYECLSNKICRKTHTNLDGSFANFTYGRGSCTDQSWRASQCPSFCLTQWSAMIKCANATTDEYCCQAQDGSLGNCDCSATSGITRPLHFDGTPSVLTTIGVTGAPSSTTSTTSGGGNSTLQLTSVSTQPITSSTTGQVATSSSKSANTTSPQPSNNRGAVIGPAVGVPLGVISLTVLLAILYRRLRRRKAARNQQGLAGNGDITSMAHMEDKAHHELLARTTTHEMPAAHEKHELPVPLSEFPGVPIYHELS